MDIGLTALLVAAYVLMPGVALENQNGSLAIPANMQSRVVLRHQVTFASGNLLGFCSTRKINLSTGWSIETKCTKSGAIRRTSRKAGMADLNKVRMLSKKVLADFDNLVCSGAPISDGGQTLEIEDGSLKKLSSVSLGCSDPLVKALEVAVRQAFADHGPL
jgi:hypothetical protein